MTPVVWLSLGLCALFFLAIAGIPLWFVVRHKEWGPHHHDGTSSPGPTPQRAEVPEPVAEPVQAELARAGGRSFPDGRAPAG
jgi:hypothetical protein